MGNYKINIFAIISLFIVSGCQSYKMTDEACSAVANNQKALIVFSSEIATGPDDSNHAAHLTWQNTAIKGEVFPQMQYKPSAKSCWDYVLYYYVVSPGEYNLITIHFQEFKPSLAGSTIVTSWLHTNNLMRFKINAGEVKYLGDIKFKYNHPYILYEVEDKYDEIYKECSNIFPTLLGRMKKELLPEVLNSISQP